MQLKKPLAAVGVAALFALAACGSGGSSSDKGGGLTTSTEFGKQAVVLDADAKGPLTIPGAVAGGVVNMYSTSTLTDENLDPAEAYISDVQAVDADLLTRSLTQWVYDSATKQDILVPDLATDLGTHNDDFTQWSFTIRDGAKWEDGTPVTAPQVAAGIDRTLDDKTFPNGAGVGYSTPFFVNDNKYEGPYTTPDLNSDAISVDGQTVTIKLSKPFGDFSYYAAMPLIGAVWTDPSVANTWPIPHSAYPDPKKYKAHPMSDGPYMIKTWTDGKLLDLVKNPNWDPKTDAGRTQYPDEYKFQIGQTPDQINALLLSDTGDAQTGFSWDGALAANYTKFKDANRIAVGTSPCTSFWAFDMKKIPDVNVRKAIGLAYAYKDAIAAGGTIPGVDAVAAAQLLPPGIAGRQDDFEALGVPGWTTDAAKAKQMLTDAGKLGFKISWVWSNSSPQAKAANDALVKGFKAAGFDPEPVMVADSEFWDNVFTPPASVNIDVTTGWCSDWPSAFTWIPPTFGTGGGNNFNKYSNPTYDAQIDAIEKMPVDQQADAWGKLDATIESTDYPILVKSYLGATAPFGSNLQGVAIDPLFGLPKLNNLWIKSAS